MVWGESLELLDSPFINRHRSGIFSGVCLLCAFSLVISGADITVPLNMILVASSCLTILQATIQEMFILEMSGRKSSTDSDIGLSSWSRPGRQITTFLLFINIILWMYDTFVTYIILLTTNHMHVVFMSSFPWGIIFRVCLPLLIFFRFHSAVRLMSLWKSSYEQWDQYDLRFFHLFMTTNELAMSRIA